MVHTLQHLMPLTVDLSNKGNTVFVTSFLTKNNFLFLTERLLRSSPRPSQKATDAGNPLVIGGKVQSLPLYRGAGPQIVVEFCLCSSLVDGVVLDGDCIPLHAGISGAPCQNLDPGPELDRHNSLCLVGAHEPFVRV